MKGTENTLKYEHMKEFLKMMPVTQKLYQQLRNRISWNGGVSEGLEEGHREGDIDVVN